jgi:hypothetical protein
MNYQKLIKSVAYISIAVIGFFSYSAVSSRACTPIIKKSVNANMNSSEIAIIADIKMAYTLLASQLDNPSAVANKFGPIIADYPEESKDVKPFNIDLELVRIHTKTSIPQIDLRLKPQRRIFIAALQKEFGEYIDSPNLHPDSPKTLVFSIYPKEIVPNFFSIAVDYFPGKKGIIDANIVSISVIFQKVI